ncbi:MULTISPECIES: hypothetical protein [Bacillus]|uniref:hypothetical protein n=1 Tax=Bacillus TaxID=1386 RepID=UPI00090AF537|nr:hypothetical protein [Bacillus safensis]APJ11009.1 hypothetical protein BSL056_08565 [Bacillus safensis]
MRIGYGYKGSPRLESTNTENFEILPLVSTSSRARIQFYKFQFRNDQDCTVLINHGDPIFIRAGDGFSTDQIDAPIISFVVKEKGIQYNFAGAHT